MDCQSVLSLASDLGWVNVISHCFGVSFMTLGTTIIKSHTHYTVCLFTQHTAASVSQCMTLRILSVTTVDHITLRHYTSRSLQSSLLPGTTADWSANTTATACSQSHVTIVIRQHWLWEVDYCNWWFRSVVSVSQYVSQSCSCAVKWRLNRSRSCLALGGQRNMY